MEKETANHEYSAVNANLFGGLETILERELAECKCPYRHLWLAVLLQAVLDVRSKKKGRVAQRNRSEAERWLLNGRKTFDRVCHFAGFDPVYTRQKVLEAKKRKYLKAGEVEK